MDFSRHPLYIWLKSSLQKPTNRASKRLEWAREAIESKTVKTKVGRGSRLVRFGLFRTPPVHVAQVHPPEAQALEKAGILGYQLRVGPTIPGLPRLQG